MPAEYVTTNDDTSLLCKMVGEGPPLLLVHGWSGSQDYFQLNVPALSSSFKVVTYDQRFHGGSDKPQHGHHVARLAADMRDVIKSLKLDNIVVVGTSMVRTPFFGASGPVV